ncbi:MAG: division/cell wall cluster transcriptional repressor MraZ [Planctomycetales bacterium]
MVGNGKNIGNRITMLLTGTFNRSIDEKQRLTIPKDLRAALREVLEGVFYVAPGTDGSLVIYDETSFLRLADRLSGASPAQRDVRAFGRLFYAQARRVALDKQGRLRVPPELFDWAGLKGEAVMVGVGDHLELWESERWGQYTAERREHYDELAESAFGRSQTS